MNELTVRAFLRHHMTVKEVKQGEHYYMRTDQTPRALRQSCKPLRQR